LLARVLDGVEGQVDDVERRAAAGELASAVDTALQVTRRSAAALRATLADAELREHLVTSMTPLAPPLPPPSIQNYAITVGGNESVPFRVAEIAVLQMAGLRRSLAEKHVDAAIAEQLAPLRSSVDLHQVLDRIEAVERAVAHAETVLPFVINRPPQRLKWRKLVTYGLGGTLIVAANAGAAVVLGPVAVAVSAAVGSAAVGAAAAPLVM
jgi:DNA-binding FrmR family transcriptional regulator